MKQKVYPWLIVVAWAFISAGSIELHPHRRVELLQGRVGRHRLARQRNRADDDGLHHHVDVCGAGGRPPVPQDRLAHPAQCHGHHRHSGVRAAELRAGRMAVVARRPAVWRRRLGHIHQAGAPIFIANWFQKRTGFAVGLYGMLLAILSAILNPCIAAVISAVGWRSAYLVLAVVAAVMILPWTLFVVRFKPERAGAQALWLRGRRKPCGRERGRERPRRSLQEGPALCRVRRGRDRRRRHVQHGRLQEQLVEHRAVGSVGLRGAARRRLGLDVRRDHDLVHDGREVLHAGHWLGHRQDRRHQDQRPHARLDLRRLSGPAVLPQRGGRRVGVVLFDRLREREHEDGHPAGHPRLFGAKDHSKIYSTAYGIANFLGAFATSLIAFVGETTGSFDSIMVLGAGLAAVSILAIVVAKATAKKLVWED